MSATVTDFPEIYGIMAEFENADALVDAARKTTAAGYSKLDCYSPVPVEELHEFMPFDDHKVAIWTLIGGLVGAAFGFGLTAWTSAVSYVHNVGGRPPISVPMFIPITFECTILFAGLTAAISMILLNGLPQPYHPVFNVERFALASRNRFFLCIEAVDPHFNRDETRRFLEAMNPEEVSEVAH